MLKRSSDRKTAAYLPVKNAYGHLSGKQNSCKGETSVCSTVCYAGKLEKWPGPREVLTDNWNTILGKTETQMFQLLQVMVAEFDEECDRRGVEKIFRIHWDGDFFSRPSARAWVRVVNAFPQVQFWCYTRSFVPACNVVPIIAGQPNLAVYISVDVDNVQHAAAALEYGVQVAALADTMVDAEGLVRQLRDRPGGMCPENIKRIPLITGKQGACASCRLCVFGKTDVRFAIKKKVS